MERVSRAFGDTSIRLLRGLGRESRRRFVGGFRRAGHTRRVFLCARWGCGGVVGCFGGYQARKRLRQALGAPDVYVALLEDVVAIAGSLWVVSQF